MMIDEGRKVMRGMKEKGRREKNRREWRRSGEKLRR